MKVIATVRVSGDTVEDIEGKAKLLFEKVFGQEHRWTITRMDIAAIQTNIETVIGWDGTVEAEVD